MNQKIAVSKPNTSVKKPQQNNSIKVEKKPIEK